MNTLTSTRTVYILGPMTGYPEENRPAFRAAAKLLRKMGFRVISADELDEKDPAGGKAWAQYLKRDIPWVVQADMGVALPGWRQSRGATLEATILGTLGIPVMALQGQDLVPIPADHLPSPSHPYQGGP